MPAKNAGQKRFMCQARGVKEGSLDPSKLNPKYRASIVKAANSMTLQQLKDYCSPKGTD